VWSEQVLLVRKREALCLFLPLSRLCLLCGSAQLFSLCLSSHPFCFFSPVMNMGSAKRIQRDLEELNNCWSGGDIAGVRLVSTKISADETPQQQYQVALVGPSNSPYAGGRFLLDAAFPLDYPFKPPHLRFVTPIYHANINEQGSIDLQALKDGCQWQVRPSLLHTVADECARSSVVAPVCSTCPLLCFCIYLYCRVAATHTQERDRGADSSVATAQCRQPLATGGSQGQHFSFHASLRLGSSCGPHRLLCWSMRWLNTHSGGLCFFDLLRLLRAWQLFKENRALYDQTAAECTRKFAMAPATQQQPAAASSTFD
jgi:ubiquitin-protein ligase